MASFFCIYEGCLSEQQATDDSKSGSLCPGRRTRRGYLLALAAPNVLGWSLPGIRTANWDFVIKLKYWLGEQIYFFSSRNPNIVEL